MIDTRDKILEEFIIEETLKILSGETKIQISEKDVKLLEPYQDKPKVKSLRKEVQPNVYNNTQEGIINMVNRHSI